MNNLYIFIIWLQPFYVFPLEQMHIFLNRKYYPCLILLYILYVLRILIVINILIINYNQRNTQIQIWIKLLKHWIHNVFVEIINLK